MTRLQSYIGAAWRDGEGEGRSFGDPVTGQVIGTVDSTGLDMANALDFARNKGGAALRAMSFAQRGAVLNAIADALLAGRGAYDEIARRNSGNTKRDAAIDIDGGIGTLKYYARLGKTLGDTKYLVEEARDQLTKPGNFLMQHMWTSRPGVAVCINAYNFPSWGLWEKVAVAVLAGVPVVAKPASTSAWLSERMVRDVVAAGAVPEGVLSLVCGSADGLLDAMTPFDHIAFTGSADTGAMIRSHARILSVAPRLNVEADSINCAVLGESAAPDSDIFNLIVREITGALTVKAGQLCTNIRRILVPQALAGELTDALAAKIDGIVSGDPANETVALGPLVNRAQQAAALEGLAKLKTEARVVRGGGVPEHLVDADPAKGAFLQPTLLSVAESSNLGAIHETEVFGPVATLIPYGSMEEAIALAARGGGSLAASVWCEDAGEAAGIAAGLGAHHGRVMCVDPDVGKGHTGHSIVMPQGVHGGPGRAGGGEELGGLRGLRFYMQRTAVQ
ncbi:MAG: 3,4-dehydroadipyl-CoA semialdehyde dehydrogenase, partial [Hyphomicrobiales bacterium]|nr:3,4-dehydroadipyl-CoA semialdehyde dehydrogenase [Hyphomicrobiales bacterium]